MARQWRPIIQRRSSNEQSPRSTGTGSARRQGRWRCRRCHGSVHGLSCDQAGVYHAMDEAGPSTVEELSSKTGLNPKYLHEWLGANAAAGYVTYDNESERFSLSNEQALVLTREGQPACMQGFFQAIVSQYESHAKAVKTFKSGKGRPWSQHSKCCFCATDRFFRPGYAANLVENWIPALDGIGAKLKSGAKIADIGCGHGSSSILLAQAYPKSKIYGFDFHEPSIIEARQKAKAAGVKNVRFGVARAQDFSRQGLRSCLHIRRAS
jgi:Methyltransferase domain